MELYTLGKKINKGRKVLIWCNSDNKIEPKLGLGERFRIIMLERGTAVITTGKNIVLANSPSVFCFNETEVPYIENSSDLRIREILFHPECINSFFTFKNIRENTKEMILTDMQESCWLRPFLKRDLAYWGYLKTGISTSNRLFQLYDTLKEELENQRDGYWPCRSRSYFLEILFLIERLFMSPFKENEERLDGLPDEIGDIIIYLHNNYREKITLESLGKLFHINRTTLQEKFCKVTGMTVMAYLIRLRVRIAELILRDTQVAISEVTERTGFNDITHFGRMFRKHTGYTPTDYRDKFCWMLNKKDA